VSNGLRVGSLAIIGDLSDVTAVGVGVVVDVLGPAVGEVDRVGALGVTGTVAALSGVEVGSRVVVSHSVVVGVGGDLIRVDFSNSVSDRGGMVGRGGVDHRGGMDHRGGVDHRGSMGNNSVGNSMSNNSMG